MHQAAIHAARDFVELVALGAFLTMVALAAHALGA
jgi:hypothetical protein